MKLRTMSGYVFVLAMGILAAGAVQAQTYELKVQNETNFEMRELYVFSEIEGEFGANLLSDGPLFSGGDTTITARAEDSYVLAVDSAGDRYLLEGLRPAEERVVSITLDSLSFGDEFSSATSSAKREVQLLNETDQRFTRVWYRPNGEDQWTALSLPNPIRAGGGAGVQVPRKASEGPIDLRVQDDEGDYYSKAAVDVSDARPVGFSFDDLQW